MSTLYNSLPITSCCRTYVRSWGSLRGRDRLVEAVREHWKDHDVLYGFMPDHGCHQIDKSAGSHGLDMEEDMNIIHFYGAKPRM